MKKEDIKTLKEVLISLIAGLIGIIAIAFILVVFEIQDAATQITLIVSFLSLYVAIISFINSKNLQKQNSYESILFKLINNFLKISDTNDSFIEDYKKLVQDYKTSGQDCPNKKRELYIKYDLPTFCSRIVLIINHIKNYKDQSLEDEKQWMNIVKSVLARTDCYKLFYASRCYVCDKEFGKLINDDLLDNLTDSICPKESISKMEWYSIFDIK
ncbi:MAG: hypothetical protein IKP62_08170 [Salinivirgaceae bacterium]|nr:hypothetical protein [Salinivirgaceae bacterium]